MKKANIAYFTILYRRNRKGQNTMKKMMIYCGILAVILVIGKLWTAGIDDDLTTDNEYGEETATAIDSIDDFYHTALTKDHDIRKLNKEYSLADAYRDHCYIAADVSSPDANYPNESYIQAFMEDYKNKRPSFLRIVESTVEGDVILIDLLYDDLSDSLYLVKDDTRDEFAALTDRIITLKQFQRISLYDHENNLYLILYNGKLSTKTFASADTFKITLV